jgi:crossover junction endodeoxyribonuclease RuvC
MRVSGLDLSLTSTGASRLVIGSASPPVVARFQVPKSLGSRHNHERLEWMLKEVCLWAHGSDLVVVEGPAFDRPQGQHQIGGLWWWFTHWCWRHHIPYVAIPPSCVKKYATGAGNADKDRVLAAVIRRYLNVEVTGNDQADSLVLACMAADWYGCPVVPVPEINRMALKPSPDPKKVAIERWPEIDQAVKHAS